MVCFQRIDEVLLGREWRAGGTDRLHTLAKTILSNQVDDLRTMFLLRVDPSHHLIVL